jgi:hypothetical protein
VYLRKALYLENVFHPLEVVVGFQYLFVELIAWVSYHSVKDCALVEPLFNQRRQVHAQWQQIPPRRITEHAPLADRNVHQRIQVYLLQDATQQPMIRR